MRWIACSAVLFLAACNLDIGETADTADPFDEAEHLARMAEVTEQLIQSSDPTQQAAGLLMATTALNWGEHGIEPPLNEAERLERLHALIDAADTALARALLAQLCASQGLQKECIRRGLDEAIVQFDDADLIARLQLTDSLDRNRARQIIVETQTLNERHMDYALLILDAMEEHGGFVVEELAVAPLIHALSLSPPFQPVSDQCALPSPEDPERSQACERILELMMEGRSSMLLTSLGSAISARRLQAQGDPDAQERHEQWQARFYDQLACFGSASDGIWETADGQFVREFLEHWQEHGEASALAMIAEKAGVDCGQVEPPPFRSALIN